MRKIHINLPEKELPVIRDLIVQSIRTRVEKVGMNGGLVALSGGIDSSLVTLLAKNALKNNLVALIMPEEGITPAEDIEDALSLVRENNIEHHVIPINSLISAFESYLPDEKYSEEQRTYVLANVKPRIRMIINYLFANIRNLLVIGTSNKTELLLGYGTKYGDLAADIYPIGDLYKTQVWQLAEFMGLPADIVKKVPSAGLWKGQTDEQELGHTYREIDSVLFCLVDLELSVRETVKLLEIDEEAVLDIYHRVIRNEHKRRTPTITRISNMCLDKDWRYPVERY